jgi:hypothetical protein
MTFLWKTPEKMFAEIEIDFKQNTLLSNPGLISCF